MNTRTPSQYRSRKRGTGLSAADRVLALQTVEEGLRRALENAKRADAPKLAAKIRSAIKSCGGAIRHAELAPYREERQARARAAGQESPTQAGASHA